MKKTITALVLALALLLGLSGCTSKKDQGSNNDTLGNSTTQNGTTNNGTQNGGTNSDGNTANNGTTNNDTNNTPSAGSRYGTNRSYGQPGSNDATDSESSDDLLGGRSYEQMLRDARVHDSDGNLNNGENSTSKW